MKKFETIEEAARFIISHANTGNEQTINDCLCFGMSVYAYTSECIAAGIPVNSNRAAFHYLNESELITLLTYLKNYDGYLIAA